MLLLCNTCSPRQMGFFYMKYCAKHARTGRYYAMFVRANFAQSMLERVDMMFVHENTVQNMGERVDIIFFYAHIVYRT